MNGLWHVIVYAFTWQNWIGNISAEVVQLAAVFGVWKAAKRWIAPRLHTVMHRALAPHLEAHLEAFKAHLSAELEKLA